MQLIHSGKSRNLFPPSGWRAHSSPEWQKPGGDRHICWYCASHLRRLSASFVQHWKREALMSSSSEKIKLWTAPLKVDCPLPFKHHQKLHCSRISAVALWCTKSLIGSVAVERALGAQLPKPWKASEMKSGNHNNSHCSKAMLRVRWPCSFKTHFFLVPSKCKVSRQTAPSSKENSEVQSIAGCKFGWKT